MPHQEQVRSPHYLLLRKHMLISYNQSLTSYPHPHLRLYYTGCKQRPKRITFPGTHTSLYDQVRACATSARIPNSSQTHVFRREVLDIYRTSIPTSIIAGFFSQYNKQGPLYTLWTTFFLLYLSLFFPSPQHSIPIPKR